MLCKIILTKISLVLLTMGFCSVIFAQNNSNDVISVPNKTWKQSRQGELEHYKDYSPNIIPEYFILGTISSYMGRYYNVKKNDQIDSYRIYEEPLVNYLVEYVREKFGISLLVEKDEKDRQIRTYSLEFAKKINDYFEKDGKLNANILKSDEEIFSFLLGVYYRNGYKFDNSIYKILLTNSTYDEHIYSSLKRIGCVKIFNKQRKYFIPVTSLYYFEPSVLLWKYFETIESEKTKLYNSYLKNSSDEERTRAMEIQYRKDERATIDPIFLSL